MVLLATPYPKRATDCLAIPITGGVYMSRFSTSLRYFRVKRNYTQKQLAALVGVSESAIGMYERGLREPNFDTLEAIADTLNVYISDLIETKSDENTTLKESSGWDEIVAATPGTERPPSSEAIDFARQILSLSPANRARILDYLAILLSQEQK